MRKELIFLLLSTPAFAGPTCQTVDVKLPRYDATAAVEKKELCALGPNRWSSPECARDPIRCKAKWKEIIAKKKIKVRNEVFGSPAFDLCLQLGGSPLMARVAWNGEEKSADFCSFTKEGLIDLELLDSAYQDGAKAAKKRR